MTSARDAVAVGGTPPAVGEAAPDFTLEDAYGRPLTLSALRGRPVLLIFFPHAFSPICTDEFAELVEQEELGALQDVHLVGVSCDPAEALRAFGEEQAAPVATRFASDFWPHGAVSRSYGVFFEPRGFPLRASFLLDAAGVVRWSVVNGPGEARDAGAYGAALRALDLPAGGRGRPDPLP